MTQGITGMSRLIQRWFIRVQPYVLVVGFAKADL